MTKNEQRCPILAIVAKQYNRLCQSNPCDCNGMLPSVKRCSEFIIIETQKKRKKAKRAEELQRAIDARNNKG
eukprot:scaffold95194_cov38-Attheya_sp.AAC.1